MRDGFAAARELLWDCSCKGWEAVSFCGERGMLSAPVLAIMGNSNKSIGAEYIAPCFGASMAQDSW